MANAAALHTSKYLAEGELRPPHQHCLFCGQETWRLVTRLQSDPDVDLLECLSCGVCSASRIPTSEALTAYYQGYYERAGAADDKEVTVGNIQSFARHLVRILHPELSKGPVRILDFGGGNGTISLSVAADLVALGYPEVAITIVEYHDQIATSG